MTKRKAPSVAEIVELRWELETVYGEWHRQIERDRAIYNMTYSIGTRLPDTATFAVVRPPSGKTIIDLTADHAAGNFPSVHVPRRKESGKAQDQSTLMEKAAQGFWYRSIYEEPQHILRTWAQSGALDGAICGTLGYDIDKWPDRPVPSELGGLESAEYKEADAEYKALCRSAWPFRLKAIDPITAYPDPSSDGKDWVIYAGMRYVHEVLREWPSWDRIVPGRDEPLKLTDQVEFIGYSDDTSRAYIVSGTSPGSRGQGLGRGMTKHGYGFNPTFFAPGGYGAPFGKPEHRFSGMLTPAVDLLTAEARRLTHLDALVAQQAFPWIFVRDGIEPDRQLGGITRVPIGEDMEQIFREVRGTIPIQEIAQELQLLRAAIQRATIPDSLGAEPNKSEESGYLRALKISTGRSRIRALTNAIERGAAWATVGFFKLTENKVKGPVSVWGEGLGAKREFVTLGPDDINGHYECVTPETRLLTADLRYVRADEIEEGDRLLGFDEHTLHGADYRYWRVAEVEAVRPVRKPCYRVTLADGTQITCSSDHSWLVAGPDTTFRWLTMEEMVRRRRSDAGPWRIVRVAGVWDEDHTYDGGYLAATFDGEGCLVQTQRTGAFGGYNCLLGFSQKANELRVKALAALAERGFTTTSSPNNKSGVFWERILGGKPEIMRFLGTIRPQRLLAKFDPERLGRLGSTDRVAVVSIEDVGEQTVLAIQTTTRTFVAEGLASHNCYVNLAPSLPSDESVDIRNGIALYQHGAIPVRDLIETYAGRENADELLRERMGEDVLKSPEMMQQLIAEALGTTATTGGPIAAPGFAAGQIPALAPQQAVGPTAGVPPLAPVAGVPTPPSPPSATQQMNNVVGRSQNGGRPSGGGYS